jgi:hypothetical protein
VYGGANYNEPDLHPSDDEAQRQSRDIELEDALRSPAPHGQMSNITTNLSRAFTKLVSPISPYVYQPGRDEAFEPLRAAPVGYISRPSSSLGSRPPSYISNPTLSTEKFPFSKCTRTSFEKTPRHLYPPNFPGQPRSIPSLTRRNLLASPAAISFLSWLVMLIYFQIYFLNLDPNPDGSWPRIGFTYAAYPFISCIGAVRATAFRTACIIVAICTVWVFSWDFAIGIRARKFPSLKGQSWWFLTARGFKLFAAVAGSAFLIAMSYANVEDGSQHDRHLIFTTLQIIGMGGTRFWDFFVSREVVKRINANGQQIPQSMAKSKFCKTIEGTVCMLCVPIVLPAIYGCSSKVHVTRVSPIEISMTGSCWGLLSYGAVLEWVMSTSWLLYMLSTGWDVVHLEEWNEDLREVPGDWRSQMPKSSSQRQGKLDRLLHRRSKSATYAEIS